MLAYNKSDFDLGERIRGKNMPTLKFDKEITALLFTRVVGPLPRLLVALVAAAVSLTAPAAVPAQQPAETGAQARSAAKTLAGERDSIRPFRVRVPQEALDDHCRRITATRWPDREMVTDASQSVLLATIQELARYWATDYDWRKCEAKLNALPQFITEIDWLDIHFIHVRSKYPKLIYNKLDRGGHFAAWEQQQLFAAELRAAFKSLRQANATALNP
jgi:hypothetical protein